jgi:hydrogenase maturation protein HypF
MTAPVPSPELAAGPRRRQRIAVRGAVQGVGFRPFVYRQATALGLAGWVANRTDGLTVEAEGEPAAVAALVDAIRRAPPANARVADVAVQDLEVRAETGFAVRPSETTGTHGTQLLPDIATCEACLAELFDPADRRYRYPFITCTQCGPRYSILEDVPYDRARTTMRRFDLCPACRAEYGDPADRRFHAETNACPACGPQLALWDPAGTELARADAALVAAAAAVRDGGIVAVKGLGGFHLIADACSDETVGRLRRRKGREAKPFAVMVPGPDEARGLCRLDSAIETLLGGPQRPIVLAPRARENTVAPSVAPGNPRLGLILAYTPLHHLLMRALGFPVVATSGNLSDEPIVTEEHAALDHLGGIADLFLVHDRPILRPLDDSVVQVVCGRHQLLRRARGYAPAPVTTDGLAPGIVAYGGHLKATVAVSGEDGAALSQHLGDLHGPAARAGHRRAVDDLCRLHRARPSRAACDLHPDYGSSRAAAASGLPVVAVQHHVAHVAACLAEHGLQPSVLGVAWDGTGYGPDGTAWGGEFLLLEPRGWRRIARLRPFRLPGGEVAAREPRRAALGLLYAAFGEAAFAMSDLPPLTAFASSERAVLHTMLERGINAPLASSVGRLFDAFASLAGLSQVARYEGEAAMALEWAAGAADELSDELGGYPFPVRGRKDDGEPMELDWRPALEAALAGLGGGADAGAVSRDLHAGLASAIVAVARRVGERRVALSGGCFQNVRLTEAAVAALHAAGFEPIWHHQVPPNDGGIALGQAAWASWSASAGDASCA